MAGRIALVAIVALLATAASARSELERRTDAADVAAFIADQTAGQTLSGSTSAFANDPQAQEYVDRIGALAARLELGLRAGADRSDTHELYRELRRVRLELIHYARRERVDVPLAESRIFEEMLGELSRYYRGVD
ncbi:MAG: hypothetical protein ACQGVC_04205 [Myxococcota bacterium]